MRLSSVEMESLADSAVLPRSPLLCHLAADHSKCNCLRHPSGETKKKELTSCEIFKVTPILLNLNKLKLKITQC